MGEKKTRIRIISIVIVIAVIAVIAVVIISKMNKKENAPEAAKNKVYDNATVVYFNPENGKICEEGEAVSFTGTKTGCMKWYVFNDTADQDKVSLLLDHNTTEFVAWNSTGQNETMQEISNVLTSDTSTWQTDYNPRIIGADEIMKAVGVNQEFNEIEDASSMIFGIAGQYDNYKDTEWMKTWQEEQGQYTDEIIEKQKNYSWLFSHTYSCKQYGCEVEEDIKVGDNQNMLVGYWTSTIVDETTDFAWVVGFSGVLRPINVDNNQSAGIRPVITVSKSIIN